MLHYAAANNKDSLALLIEMFPDEVENLLSARDIYGNTALQLAVTYNAESLPSLTGRFLAQMLNMKNARGDTVLHYAAANKNSLEYLMSMFQKSWLAVRNSNASTVLHIAAFQSPDSLEYLIKTFSGKVKDLLEIKDRDGQTALHLAAQYKSKSLEYLVNVFGDKVFDLKDNNGRTALHVANTDSLQFLVQKFGDRIIEVKNKHGNTVLHYAAALNKNSLAVLIEMFPNEVKSLLSKKDFHGHTVWHYTINNKDSLALLIASFPNEVESLFNEVYHSIAPNLRQLIDNLLIRFVSSNNVIDSDNNMDIYGAEVGIAIPGIPEALSYYYQDHVSFLLKLRLEDAKPGALKSVDVLEEIIL